MVFSPHFYITMFAIWLALCMPAKSEEGSFCHEYNSAPGFAYVEREDGTEWLLVENRRTLTHCVMQTEWTVDTPRGDIVIHYLSSPENGGCGASGCDDFAEVRMPPQGLTAVPWSMDIRERTIGEFQLVPFTGM